MPPLQPLPVSARFSTPEEYISSLLAFSADPLLRTLCGGVHILDFFTRDSETTPKDLYRTVLPSEWIAYFEAKPIEYILDLLIRTPLDCFDADVPPELCTYIRNVREHSLQREFIRQDRSEKTKMKIGCGTEWALNSGMKPKKIHEVENFAAFLDDLVLDISGSGASTEHEAGISHVVDYGSGQAYLSRTVAKKYGHNVVGIESRTVNIDGAKVLDRAFDTIAAKKLRHKLRVNGERQKRDDSDCSADGGHGIGNLQYIQTHISDGNLDEIINTIEDVPQSAKRPGRDEYASGHSIDAIVSPNGHSPPAKSLLLTSLHSCGNLVHHALAAFRNTSSVRAVALIGCCYNLLTEKHGTTFKPPYLRNPHPRLIKTSTQGDPQGFPISTRFTQENVQLNITARSMACQAPANWTEESSADFFLRHYYRALLQRIFLDCRLLGPVSGDPIIIGSLRKPSYNSFYDYVTAAIKKLEWEEKVVITKELAEEYERTFKSRKKELSVVWSLMAFSAGVVESLIVLDRWLYLKEMGCEKAWVEAAFDYSASPRNLVVVGVR